MLEILAFVGALAIGYALWLGFRFRNFRKRLLDAFEYHGLSRATADDLYTMHNAAINDLHVNRGMSPELIALSILAEIGMEVSRFEAAERYGDQLT